MPDKKFLPMMYSELDLDLKNTMADQFLRFFELKEIPEALRTELCFESFENLVCICWSAHLAWAKDHKDIVALNSSSDQACSDLIDAFRNLSIADALTYVLVAAKEIGTPEAFFIHSYLDSCYSYSSPEVLGNYRKALPVAMESIAEQFYDLEDSIAQNAVELIWSFVYADDNK